MCFKRIDKDLNSKSAMKMQISITICKKENFASKNYLLQLLAGGNI